MNSTEKSSQWHWSGWEKLAWVDGYLQGKASGVKENIISSPELSINADKFRYLELFCDNDGVPLQTTIYFFTDNNSPMSNRSIFTEIWNRRTPFPQKITIDLGKCPQWKGTIKKLMLSFPPRSSGSLFTLRDLAFVEKPNYLYNGSLLLMQARNLPLAWKVDNSKNVTISRINPDTARFGSAELLLTASGADPGNAVLSTEMDHMRNGHYYTLTLGCTSENTTSWSATVKFLAIDGSALSEVPVTFNENDKNASMTFQIPELAYIGKLCITCNLQPKSTFVVRRAQLDYLGSRQATWNASWIWLDRTAEQQQAWFFKQFTIDNNNIAAALLEATCDDEYKLYINGRLVSSGTEWTNVQVSNIAPYLKDGENIIAAECTNKSGYNAGLLAEIRLADKNGELQFITTDSSWSVADKKPALWPDTKTLAGQKASVIGRPPCNPWATVPYYTELPQKKSKTKPPSQETTLPSIKYLIDNSLNYPRLCADGKVLTPLMFGGPCEYPSTNFAAYKNAVRSGFHIYRFWFEFGAAWKPGSYDVEFAKFETQIEELVSADPDAKIILGFRISAPSWWLVQNPNDVCHYSDGKTDGAYGILPSTGSRRWRDDVKRYLDTFIKHTESQWYANRIIAYVPSSHCGPEWVLSTKTDQYPDYSPAMISFFRQWLRDKYKTDEQLQLAWKDAHVTFATAQVPARDLRDPVQYFLDPNDQPVFDFNRCLNASVTSAVLEFQEHIRKLSNGRSLNFSYYGYIFELAQLAIYPQISGHYDLTTVLNSPWLDAAASPVDYGWRQSGSVSAAVTAVSSFALHNKLWIQEADIRTNLTPDGFDNKDSYNMQNSLDQLAREFSYALTRRLGIWYFDMSGGWYDNPLFEEYFRTMHRAYNWAIERPISWKSPIAVFFDETMMDRTSLQREHWGADNVKEMLGSFRYGLGRCGTPYDSYVLDDIYRISPDQYKVIILLNSWQKNVKLKEYLDRNFKNNGHMIIWIYAPGYSGPTFDLKNMSYMTGFNFGYFTNVNLGYKLNRDHSLFSADEFASIPGGDEKLCPHVSFYITDPNVQVLGTSLVNSRPNFVMRSSQSYTSVYMASPDGTGAVWKKLFGFAGITPIVNRTDCVYYDGDFLGLHFIDGSGKRTITLDHKASSVWDVFSGKKISDSTSELTIDAEPCRSRLLFLGSEQEFLRIFAK